MTAPTEVKVPDIGDFTGVPVIEIHVSPGDQVNAEDPLVTLESDKATLDVPAPAAGSVAEILVKVGDEVSEGSPDPDAHPRRRGGHHAAVAGRAAGTGPVRAHAHRRPPSPPAARRPHRRTPRPTALSTPEGVHAGPSVRRTARELGVDLSAVTPTGAKGRITKDDLLAFLKGPAQPAAAAAAAPAGSGIPEIPAQDFSKFGPIDTQPLPRIKKVSGPFLHRSWLNVPHVTHNDEADITDLDRYRKELDTAAKGDRDPYRVTLLAFLVKACVGALKKFPEFNSSLSPEKDALILKQYYNIGIAVDTPGGLVVPVVKDADRKGIVELSREFMAISAKARDGKLGPSDMAGGTFTISSLGGIGGTGFTPIVNAPEVAILGVVRSKMSPVWNGTEFVARNMLPISLSFDHRVVDGALAARFARHLCYLLEDDRRLLL